MGTEHFCAAGLVQVAALACGSAGALPTRAGSHRGAPSVIVSLPSSSRVMDAFPLPHRPAAGDADERFMPPLFCAVPPLPIKKTALCKGRWFSRASVTLTQQCCILGCLVLFYLHWYLQCFLKYRYLGFVVCFNSQTSASSSKLSLKVFKTFA